MSARRLRKILIATTTTAALTMTALTGGAAETAGPDEVTCRRAVEQRLAAWNADRAWIRDPDGALGERQWRIPTREIGRWLLLSQPRNGQPALARIDASGLERIAFDAQCREKATFESSATPPADAFTDRELRALVAAEPRGVIFVWSPHMPLSVDAYRTVAEVARRMDLSFTALRDPMSDAAYAAAVAREAGLPASALRMFASVELSFRQATLHAPAVVVFANGRFAGLAVPGYREAAGFEAAISDRLRTAPAR